MKDNYQTKIKTFLSSNSNNMKNKKKDTITIKHSLRFKFTITLTILVMLTILLIWVLNKSFLETYYLKSKVNTLGTTYEDLNRVFSSVKDNDDLTTEDMLLIEQISEKKNIKIYIANEKFFLVYPLTLNNIKTNEELVDFKEYMFTGSNPDVKSKTLIKESEGYYIFKVLKIRLESQYIDLIGILDNDYYIFMQTNYESMQESVSIANQFLAYVGIIVVIVGSIVMLFISKRFTKPILELASIAKKMADLDFNVRYEVNTKDEIGELGYSINTLSEKLEKTISELKSANNELLSDIQDKIQIDEMRKDFLSNVTHELKTPIALIQGYAEGLMDNIHEDKESKEFYCDVIIDEAKKMNTMVKKLLTLNQFESGYNQVNIERFDLVALITTILDSTEILFNQKNVQLLYHNTEPIYVWSDEYLVEEVLNNYISNALNHVDGANIVEIKLIHQNNVIRVAVFNTGANIPEEDINNIWIKFYKVDKARTREYGGSGIGLSIVKAIMTSLNQSFGVVNHGTGVEFWFELDTKVE